NPSNIGASDPFDIRLPNVSLKFKSVSRLIIALVVLNPHFNSTIVNNRSMEKSMIQNSKMGKRVVSEATTLIVFILFFAFCGLRSVSGASTQTCPPGQICGSICPPGQNCGSMYSYILNDNPSSGGQINSESNGYEFGPYSCSNSANVQVTAQPASGYSFVSWSISGGTISSYTSNPATMTVPCPGSPVLTANYAPYYSNGNEGVNISGDSSSSAYIDLSAAITSSGNSPWSYQYNLFWYSTNCTNNWCVSQTTVEVSQSSCTIGTGY